MRSGIEDSAQSSEQTAYGFLLFVIPANAGTQLSDVDELGPGIRRDDDSGMWMSRGMPETQVASPAGEV